MSISHWHGGSQNPDYWLKKELEYSSGNYADKETSLFSIWFLPIILFHFHQTSFLRSTNPLRAKNEDGSAL